MALIKRSVVGPDEIKLKYFRENGEYRILVYRDGKFSKKETEYYNDKEDGLAAFDRWFTALQKQYCRLPSCFDLPVIDYQVHRPNLKDEYTVAFYKHDTKGNRISQHTLRYYMSIQSHSMTVCLNVDFDGIRWHQEEITEHNREAAVRFWQELGKEEFEQRNHRIEKLRKNADEYFSSLKD
jgi:hypothetical protein